MFVSDILVIREKIYVNVIQSSTELFFLCMVWEKWKASVFFLVVYDTFRAQLSVVKMWLDNFLGCLKFTAIHATMFLAFPLVYYLISIWL